MYYLLNAWLLAWTRCNCRWPPTRLSGIGSTASTVLLTPTNRRDRLVCIGAKPEPRPEPVKDETPLREGTKE
ncbi:hypothetical protein F4777DRAFT_547993 [Nemania sp. FL0916]|nr:hypothetical protein F4777DRAFT_547993 [Nemania sp. FL0916]